jgi:hypothetical protein
MDDLIDLINTNWLYDVHVRCEEGKQSFFSKFMDVEDALMMDNKSLYQYVGFYKDDEYSSVGCIRISDSLFTFLCTFFLF